MFFLAAAFFTSLTPHEALNYNRMTVRAAPRSVESGLAQLSDDLFSDSDKRLRIFVYAAVCHQELARLDSPFGTLQMAKYIAFNGMILLFFGSSG